MLQYNEVKERKYIVLDGEPYEVLESHVFRKQQRKPVNQTKLRHLIKGTIKPHSFHSTDVVEEADMSKRKIKFLYSKENRQTGVNEFWFTAENNPSDRFFLTEDVIGTPAKFMKINSVVDAEVFDEKIIGVALPIKVDLKVIEAAPAVKGNTATNATKTVKVETGATLNVPLFINEGDILKINTETGEYTERVS